ncbi:MAG: hypothetical protein RLZZ265_1568 [Verrucomicrobiota bacterium]|jgi:hypothetical protein
MWKAFIGLFQRGYALWDRVNKVEERLNGLSQEQAQLKAQLEFLAREVQRDRENGTHEREKHLLQLENALLKFERRLPPSKPSKGK